mmetsp:Transcript_20224/g.29603  ORF Transcript_20224/g.29603 Transcript_20224/m.29603 type:complete len:155 (+) Transcript_20224:74-538(+)
MYAHGPNAMDVVHAYLKHPQLLLRSSSVLDGAGIIVNRGQRFAHTQNAMDATTAFGKSIGSVRKIERLKKCFSTHIPREKIAAAAIIVIGSSLVRAVKISEDTLVSKSVELRRRERCTGVKYNFICVTTFELTGVRVVGVVFIFGTETIQWMTA